MGELADFLDGCINVRLHATGGAISASELFAIRGVVRLYQMTDELTTERAVLERACLVLAQPYRGWPGWEEHWARGSDGVSASAAGGARSGL